MSSHNITRLLEYDFRSLPYLRPSSGILRSAPYVNFCDSDLLVTPNISNFNYYTPHELRMTTNIQQCVSLNKCLSILHCNIRSLAANYDQLITVILELNDQLSVIGLSETKHTLDQFNLLNTEMKKYRNVSFS